MIKGWMDEVKATAGREELGMILVHNGIVRGTSKTGEPVHGMKLSYDRKKLDSAISIFQQKPGIAKVKVWINAGDLKIGDDIMVLLVAGRFRTDVLPVFQELLSLIKNEIVTETETPA